MGSPKVSQTVLDTVAVVGQSMYEMTKKIIGGFFFHEEGSGVLLIYWMMSVTDCLGANGFFVIRVS